MEALLLRLQEDVAARKNPRSEIGAAVRSSALLAIAFGFAFQLGGLRNGEPVSGSEAGTERFTPLIARIDSQEGEIEMQRLQLDRLERAFALSIRYEIPADLAIAIEEVAMAEGIDPALAFELVRVESGFNPRAVSPVGALGLTQLMPSTAEILSPGITRQQIFERDTNLRLGFRFFRAMVGKYDGDVRLALLAYNRGPGTVDRLLAGGDDPGNGYARSVLGGVREQR